MFCSYPVELESDPEPVKLDPAAFTLDSTQPVTETGFFTNGDRFFFGFLSGDLFLDGTLLGTFFREI